MEESYRNNLIELSLIYLNKKFDLTNQTQNEFNPTNFTNFLFKQLFNTDINITGYGLNNSTQQMTNNIGDLKIYNEADPKKQNYLDEIKKGDLVFFHTQALHDNTPSPNNHYPGHVGLYLGQKNFIHYSTEEETITIDAIENEWLTKLVASRDIIKEISYKNHH